MAIRLKNKTQIEKMRESGRIVAEVLQLIEKNVRPGVTTAYLDGIAEEHILKRGGIPSFKGYNDFPAAICASVNEEIIHGIPGLRKLKSGDIISIDVGVYKDGFHGDAARTFPVGDISDDLTNLIAVTKQSFFEALPFAIPGCRLHQISGAIQDYVESHGYSVVRAYVGHGIGRNLHEAPQIPNYRDGKRGVTLCDGMALAVEPMVNVGTFEAKVLSDDWTVITKDKKCSAHYENTIVIVDGKPELLTVYE